MLGKDFTGQDIKKTYKDGAENVTFVLLASQDQEQKEHTGDKLERIAMDILGPLPETPNGNQYILIVSD